jgi:hypothetical protein
MKPLPSYGEAQLQQSALMNNDARRAISLNKDVDNVWLEPPLSIAAKPNIVSQRTT